MYNPETLRPVKSISSTGAYTITTYDDTAMTVSEEVRQVDGTLSGQNKKIVNGIGKVKREEALGANGIWDFVETKYNKLGETWKQSRPFRGNGPLVYSENIFDSQGRTKQIIEPDGSLSTAYFNETSRPDSASTAIGNTTRVVDAWGRERWGRYDQQGRLAEVVEPNPNGNGTVSAAGSLKTSYQYDTLGRLIETNQGVQVRKFKYDSLGRLTKQKLSEQTATINDAGVYVGAGNSNAIWSEAFVYDNRSNLVQKTDARNVKSNYTYTKPDTSEDPLNRIQKISYDISGSSNVLSAPDVTYSYLATGDKARISQVRTAGILTEDFSYDVEGRLYESTETVDGRTSYPMKMSYLYDSLDRTKEVRYPAQYGLAGSPRKIIEPTYDVASRLSSLKVNSVVQAGDIVYNSSDQTESIKIGATGANQVTETFEYNGLSGLLTNQKAIRNGTNLMDLNYDYAKNNSVGTGTGKTGHLTKITDNLNTNKNKEYEFDALGRLTKAKGGVQSTNFSWQQTYSYDRFGNRVNVAANGNGIDGQPMQKDGIGNLTYDNSTNRITNSGVTYDVAGNQTRALAEDGVTWLKYEYDAANRLQVIRKDSDNSVLEAFQFGSTNQRLMKTDYALNQTTIYSGDVEYTEYVSTIMTWTKSYVRLGDSILSTITPNGNGGETTEFNHSDQLGTRLVTNQTTGTYTEQTTLPFGTGLASETSRAESKRFTSYDRSARTGLDYAINRTYDSKLGRFTQVDPIDMDAVDFNQPQTLNLYSYCGNDPINHTDPDGLFWGAIGRWIKKQLKWILAAVAVALAVVAVVLFPWSAPVTLKAVLGLVAALASAASSVFGATGHKTLSTIFAFIAFAAAIGSLGIQVKESWDKVKARAVWKFGDDIYASTIHEVVTVKVSFFEKVVRTLVQANSLYTDWNLGGYDAVTFGYTSKLFGITPSNQTVYNAGYYTAEVASCIIPGGAAVKGLKLGNIVVKSGRFGKASKLFGRGGNGKSLLNGNNYFRVGWSWLGSANNGKDVFRVGIGNKNLKIFGRKVHRHINILKCK